MNGSVSLLFAPSRRRERAEQPLIAACSRSPARSCVAFHARYNHRPSHYYKGVITFFIAEIKTKTIRKCCAAQNTLSFPSVSVHQSLPASMAAADKCGREQNNLIRFQIDASSPCRSGIYCAVNGRSYGFNYPQILVFRESTSAATARIGNCRSIRPPRSADRLLSH